MGFRHTRGKRGSRGTRGRKQRGGAGQAKGGPGVHKGVTVNARNASKVNANTNIHNVFEARRKSNAYSGGKLKYLLERIDDVIENAPYGTFTPDEKKTMTRINKFLSTPGKFTLVVGHYDVPQKVMDKEPEILDFILVELERIKAYNTASLTKNMMNLLERLYLTYFH